MKLSLSICLCALLCACTIQPHEKEDHQIIVVKKATSSPTIDGKGSENSWNIVKWHPIDQNWQGNPYEHKDFNGRYKLTWNNNKLFILVEIEDDTLYDRVKNPLKLWWNDDSIQVYIDEDNSGGLHQFNHNAFGYHISLDGNVVDLNVNKKPQLYNDNIVSKRITEDHLSVWEMAITVFDSNFDDEKNNGAVQLTPNKKIGFALAYSDNDTSTERENFIGSVFVSGEDKNKAWIDADIFGTLILKE